MVWPTLELRMAREENGTGCCISIIYYTTCDLQGYANKANDIKNIFKRLTISRHQLASQPCVATLTHYQLLMKYHSLYYYEC